MPADLPSQQPGYYRPAGFVRPHDVPDERPLVHPLTALEALVRNPAPHPRPEIRPVDVLLGAAPTTVRVFARQTGTGIFRLTANDPR